LFCGWWQKTLSWDDERVRRLTSLALIFLALGCTPKRDTFVERTTGMVLVKIPAGSFRMGSPAIETGHREDEFRHVVTLTRPFYIGETEVTRKQWRAVMGTDPSQFKKDEDAPVENVSWFDAQEFIKRLNAKGEGHFRLPTEAEWEYACRAGTETQYAYGERISAKVANYDARYPLPGQLRGEYRAAPTPVKKFPPNKWGLYDMHGNVWEWCEDEYCPYPRDVVRDPAPAQCNSNLKVIRGGSWYFGADSARSALRYTHAPNLKGFSLGFRIVRD
jgi:sulfatase modifying factor 1